MKKTSVLMSAAGGPFGIALPEDGALGLEPVEDDEPVEVAQAGAMQAGVGTAAAGVLAEEKVPLHLAAGHAVEGRQLRVVAVDARQPGESSSRWLAVAASPYQALSRLTMNLRKLAQ